MIKSSNGKQKFIDLMLIISGIFGIYLIVAWASYSPLDNAWSVASTVTENATLNKTGALVHGGLIYFMPFLERWHG